MSWLITWLYYKRSVFKLNYYIRLSLYEPFVFAIAENTDLWLQCSNNRLDTLKKHLPFSGEEGLQDLEETALRFEESIFTTATSQVCISHLCINLRLDLLEVKFTATSYLFPLFCSQIIWERYLWKCWGSRQNTRLLEWTLFRLMLEVLAEIPKIQVHIPILL